MFREYLNAPAGRMLSITTAFALFSAGAFLYFDPSMRWIPLVLMVIISSCVVLVGLTLRDHFPVAVWLVIALPVVGGPYFATVFSVRNQTAGIILFVLALIPAFVALRGVSPPSRTSTSAAG